MGGTINLRPGHSFVFTMGVTIDNSPFPQKLKFRYFPSMGSIQATQMGRTGSYVAPSQPGTDIIGVEIEFEEGASKITRSILVDVQDK